MLIAILIPDLPWLWLKLFLFLEIFDPYQLRLYFTAQASLFFCLIVAGAIALTTRKTWRIFLILSANCLLHLIFDSLQIKWGNGVNFFAPYHWNMTHFGLFWPEHPIFLAGSLLGIALLFTVWGRIVRYGQTISGESFTSDKTKSIFCLFFLLTYLVGPFLFFESMNRANTYYLQTMADTQARPGKKIEFDRARFSQNTNEILIYSGEKLQVHGAQPSKTGRVSFKGKFISENSFTSSSYHYHTDNRDFATVIGLFLTCTLLCQSLVLPTLKK